MEFQVKIHFMNCWEAVVENSGVDACRQFGPSVFEHCMAMLDATDGTIRLSVLHVIHGLIQAGVSASLDCLLSLESIALGDDDHESGMLARVILDSLRSDDE
jgi:hypothetical protein